jgi:hypothetical protein
MRCTAELLTKEAPYKGQPSVLTSPTQELNARRELRPLG